MFGQLAVYVSNQVPEIVVGDPGRFRQIITNLVGNSVKVSALVITPSRLIQFDDVSVWIDRKIGDNQFTFFLSCEILPSPPPLVLVAREVGVGWLMEMYFYPAYRFT